MEHVQLSDGAVATLAALDPDAMPFEEMSAREARAAFDATWPQLQAPASPDGADFLGPLSFAGNAGAIPALAWRGTRAPAAGARALLYLHGGGFVVGSSASHAAICRRLASAADAVVVSPDYRLAPEHRFPEGLDDALSCLAQLADRAAELGISPDRIALGGDSAGGNLGAVLAICAARQTSLPAPTVQLLFYPVTSASADQQSYTTFREGFGLTAMTMRWFLECYVNGPGDVEDWRVSPLLADLDDRVRPLAPAFVAIAEADILRDEGLAYAARLAATGVPTRARTWYGHLHGFLSHCRYDPAAYEAVAEAAEFWRSADG